MKNLLSIVIFLLAQTSHAEPWFGSRFARTCQSCHEPERLQRAPIDRRCSLSCQGCHVSPNGGGLRSHYGKWNAKHFLPSFKAKKSAPDKRLFVPKVPQNSDRTEAMRENVKEYKYHLSENDPWRQMGASRWDGGADMRWFSGLSLEKINGKETQKSVHFPMAINFGLRYRPFYRKLHFVYESQIVNSPAPKENPADYFGRSKTKSMYVMLDDMPWNTFVMAGIYRPLFGNYDPYHYSLPQQMTSVALKNSRSAYDLNYSALSIGTAPNVPYANLHLVGSRLGSNDKSWGVAGNLGFRGVRFGQSLNYSFWLSADPTNAVYIAMHAVGVFVNKTPWTIGYEITSLTRRELQVFRQGGVQALDIYLQTWRNIYLQTSFASANTSVHLTSGSSAQMRMGVRGFIYHGIELGLHGEIFRDQDFMLGTDTKKTSLQLNFHAHY